MLPRKGTEGVPREPLWAASCCRKTRYDRPDVESLEAGKGGEVHCPDDLFDHVKVFARVQPDSQYQSLDGIR